MEAQPQAAAMDGPVVLLAFDRPDLLAEQLAVLRARDPALAPGRVHLFLDGDWCPRQGVAVADPLAQEQCAELLQLAFPGATLHGATDHLGPLLNFRRAAVTLLEAMGAEAMEVIGLDAALPGLRPGTEPGAVVLDAATWRQWQPGLAPWLAALGAAPTLGPERADWAGFAAALAAPPPAPAIVAPPPPPPIPGRTLFLGSYGFGNLGDELCLIEAMRAFPCAEPWVWSADPAHTARCVPGIAGFIADRAEIATLRAERVVLGGGGVGFFPSIRDMLHWMDDAGRLGARCHIHNIGAAMLAEREWARAVQVERVLAALASCSVRDDMSRYCLREWAPALDPLITRYPERLLEADPALRPLLPQGVKLLGISITGQAQMTEALARNEARMHRALEAFAGHVVVPIISCASPTDPEEDDIAGFHCFRDRFLAGRAVACEQFLDRAWWAENLTPLRLKGLIAGLDTLLSQRKHNVIHAIGAGTRCIGVFPSIDDSIARIFFTLRDEMPEGSAMLSLTLPA